MDNKTLMKIMIGAIAFIAGLIVGSLWSENRLLKNGLTPTSGTTGNTPAAIAPTAPTTKSLSKMPEITDADHVRGNPNAKVVLVEYSDYECPWCSRFHPTMLQVMEEYGDKVAWVYRHYPAPSLGHAQAQISAEAAECVAKLAGNDAFWKYSDTLFENTSPLVESQQSAGSALTEEKLMGYATAQGINSAAMQNCLDNEEMTALVNEHKAGGVAAGIGGTPGTILVTKDGDFEEISGAQPFEQVKATIDQYL